MLIHNKQRLFASLLALGIAPGMAVAQETTEQPATEEMVIVEAEPSVNEVEVGVGYIENDAYRFGRYNGMKDDGAYFIGDIKAKSYGDEAGFWRLRGTNLRSSGTTGRPSAARPN